MPCFADEVNTRNDGDSGYVQRVFIVHHDLSIGIFDDTPFAPLT